MQAHLNENASSTSDFLSKIGAPGEQISQVAGQVAPAGAHDTLYGLRGYIPASTLNEEGAAFTAAAKMLPGDAFSQGLGQISKVQAAQREADAQFATEIQKIAATAPQLHAQIVKDIADAKYKEASLALRRAGLQLSASRLRLSAQNQAFNQRLGIAKYNTGIAQFNARQSYNYAKLARQAYQSDRSYGLQLASFGLRQKSFQLRALAQEAKFKNGGFSPTKLNEFKTDAAFVISEAKGAATRPTYDSMMAQMLKRHVPISMAQDAIRKYDPTLPGSPIDTQRLSDYNTMVGRGTSPKANDLVGLASSAVGTPYSWGGGGSNGPSKGIGRGSGTVGFDCSGFTQWALAKVGIHIGGTTYEQVKQGRGVSLKQLQPGDLVFTERGKSGLPEHVGLYVGNGMIQESPHTGDVNKVIPLKDFLGGGFVAARRYLRG